MSATPLTDAEDRRIFSTGSTIEFSDAIDRADWEWKELLKFARTLELRCQELEKEVQYLKSSECEAAWCDRWKNLCAQNEQLREALDKVGFRCAGNALTKAEATHISNFILQTLSQSTPAERK